MDSSKFHQAVPPSAGLGLGATLAAWDGFNSLPQSRQGGTGGGSRPRRDRPSYGLKKLFARLSTLSLSRQTVKVRGQALVELAVILPVLVLFMAAVIPLIVKGVTLPWLDERLTLRQLSQDDEQVHRLLQLTHESDLLPPYFDNTSLEESTHSASMGLSIPLLGKTFPGNMTRKLTIATLPEHGWWNREIFGSTQGSDPKISRDLTMVAAQVPVESEVFDEVKRLTLVGLATGKTNILEKTGFNLFHLNLDALPETAEGGETK